MEYQWLKSDRKSIAIQVQENGEVIVRSPKNISKQMVDQFVESKMDWIKNSKANVQSEKQKKFVFQKQKDRYI